MKILLALITCHSRQHYANAQRETWIPSISEGLDYKFFLGPSDRTPRPDEVFLDCDDSYSGLPNKVQAVIQWALEHNYDFMIKMDDDVVFIPTKFLASGFYNQDFCGHMNEDGGDIKAPWGFCYTLSKRAMELIATHPLPGNGNDEVWVSRVLAQSSILLHHEPRYHLHRGKRSEFLVPTKRPLRAPPRPKLMDEETSTNGIAYCVFLHWAGYHNTPDDINIKEYHKLFKEVGNGR